MAFVIERALKLPATQGSSSPLLPCSLVRRQMLRFSLVRHASVLRLEGHRRNCTNPKCVRQ